MTAIETKFGYPYSILFMAELKEEILGEAEYKYIKNLKAHLVRSQLPDFDEVGRSNRVEEKDLLVIYVKI